MHFTNAFAFVLVFLSITSMESPLSPPTSATPPDVNGRLDVRQPPLILQIIGEVILQVGADILTDLITFNADKHAMQRNFTVQTLISLRPHFPHKNLLVYHNKKSKYSFSSDAVHAHYELQLPDVGPFRSTYGYEIWVFDSGTFTLAGPSGYEHWGTKGCFSQSGPPTKLVYKKCQ